MKYFYYKNGFNINNNAHKVIHQINIENIDFLINLKSKDFLYKLGLSNLLKESLSYSMDNDCIDITSHIIALSQISEQEISNYGDDVYKKNYNIISNCSIFMENNNIVLSGKDSHLIDPDIIFNDFPNNDIIFLYDTEINSKFNTKTIVNTDYELSKENSPDFFIESKRLGFINCKQLNDVKLMSLSINKDKIKDRKSYEKSRIPEILKDNKFLQYININIIDVITNELDIIFSNQSEITIEDYNYLEYIKEILGDIYKVENNDLNIFEEKYKNKGSLNKELNQYIMRGELEK